MEKLNTPGEMDFQNGAEKWTKWRQKFEIYLHASGKHVEDEKTKVAVLLNLLGDEGLDIFNTFGVEDKTLSFDDVLNLFDAYCLPKKNVVIETFKFNNIFQKPDQPVENYLTELKNQADLCDFKCESCSTSFKNRMIRDKLLLGMVDKELQSRLLREKSLTLDVLSDTIKSVEVSKKHSQMLKENVDVNSISKSRSYNKDSNKDEKNKTQNFNQPELPLVNCQKCGLKHQMNKCPAYGKICNRCHRYNHYANVCRNGYNYNGSYDRGYEKGDGVDYQNRNRNFQSWNSGDKNRSGNFQTGDNSNGWKNQNQRKAVQNFNVDNMELSHSNQGNDFFTNKLEDEVYNIGNIEGKGWLEDISIENFTVTCKLDTGAEISVLPKSIFDKINLKNNNQLKLNPTSIRLVTYGNFNIMALGKIKLNCSVNSTRVMLDFVIVENNLQPLLGIAGCINLNLIKRIDSTNCELLPNGKDELISKFKAAFDGLGEFPGLHKIQLKSDSVPVVQYNKRVPFGLQNKLKETLETLESKNIISKVDYPTEWVNNIMLVEKPNGKLRICLDPKPLNNCIQREHYLIPTADDILSRLSGKNMFSVIDMKDGFWQIKIDKESSDLCTFNTPFGRWKFLRLPFGICSAPELFQKKNVELFGDIPNVEIYFDDMIISGVDQEDHDRTLRLVLERAIQYNVKFNSEKLQLRLSEVTFMGNVISKDGIKPDQKHVLAITSLKSPTNKAELLRLLGICKYVAKFIPNLSKITANLRELTKNSVDWSWKEEHEKEFLNLKNLIATAPVLKIYDQSKPLVIQTDASKDGLGCVLLQEGRIVSSASRCLTKSEIRYAQIEKELLAIVFATERFNQYIYGGKTTVVNSDHKPLVNIFKQDLDKATARLQRMLLKLLKYNIQIEYMPGRDLLIADALSRSYMLVDEQYDEQMQYIIHSVVNKICMSENNKIQFQKATDNDKILLELKNCVINNWPGKNSLSNELKKYYKIKNQINVSENLLMFNQKLIVPVELRPNVLRMLHESHLGIEKTKLRGRELFYWPGMSIDIENYVKDCNVCQKFKNCNQKEPLKSHELPECAWERVATDIFFYANKPYLVVFDAYSNWIEVVLLRDMSAETCISQLKLLFTRLGVPNYLQSDNVPFNSFKFKEFANAWNFNLVFSSPRYPQSNGLAEKGVSIAKNLIKKFFADGKYDDFQLGLLEYKNTPLPDIGLSPAQLFMGRNLKTRLPISIQNLKPNNFNYNEIQNKIINKRARQEYYYNKNAKSLPSLKNNENIMIRKNNVWHPGQVISKYNNRSYIVKDENGTNLRRNRKFLNQTNSQFKLKNNFENNNNNSQIIESQSNQNLNSNITDRDDQLIDQPIEVNVDMPRGSNMVTRSGRIVKPPAYLQDFVLT